MALRLGHADGRLGFDPSRFALLEERMAPTIYWLHQVEAGANVMGGYRQSWNRSARPVLVAQHHYIIHPSLPYLTEGMFPGCGRRWVGRWRRTWWYATAATRAG